MKLKSHLKNGIATTLIIGTLMVPMQGEAASSGAATSVATGAGTGAASGAATSSIMSGFSGLGSGLMTGALTGAGTALLSNWVGAGWAQVITGAAGTAMSWIMTDFFWQKIANIDAAQLALEYLVYDAMKDVTDKWKPEPKETYEKIAEENEDYTTVETEDLQVESEEAEKWNFEVQALKNVGIEALGLTNVSDIAGGRESVMTGLSRLKTDGSLDTDMDQETNDAIKEKQRKNYQWMSTAGVARAELGLEVANQAAVDAGGDAAQISNDTSGDGNIVMNAAAAEDTNVGLREWPSQISSTGMGMRVQILMNLELAQRINLANALQGNTLSIEAARALKKAPRVIRKGDSDE